MSGLTTWYGKDKIFSLKVHLFFSFVLAFLSIDAIPEAFNELKPHTLEEDRKVTVSETILCMIG